MTDGYVPIYRRRREGLTDYGARKKAVTSRHTLLAVRITDKNVTSQFLLPKEGGDEVLSSSHSRQLLKLGWKGSLKSTPACYLLGLYSGKRALEKGVKAAVLYNGVEPFVRGSRVAAFVKGVVDAGVSVPVGEEALPSQERVSGKPIADYASKLASEDKDLYSKAFSTLTKRGFKPEEYPLNFEATRSAIMGSGKK
ncbi:MAG TPA: 50S ribosomal protein L18 [Nitrososphaerales archaeon]|nr:50S ribosomal protein L18 [Nitrososphaerales archaeon]